MAQIVSRRWTQHPNHLPKVDRRFGASVSAWLPGVSPFDAAGVSHLTYSTRAAFNAGFRGPQVQFTGAQFTAAVTIPTITGASSESWLCVLGSTISTANSARLLNAAGDGLSCSTASLIVRASSTNVITSTNAPVAGDAFFFQIKNADYRLYHKGAKQTSTSTLGNEFISSAMQQTNDSIALLARWTNEIPDDELIWELLGNPWALFEPRRIFVPVAASSGTTSSADPGAFSIAGSDATDIRALASAADSGSFAVSGSAATGVKSTISAADSGSYAITGVGATDILSRLSSADQGSISITGAAATDIRALRSTADSGSITVSGVDAASAISGVEIASPGAFVITGFPATALYAVWPAEADVRAGVTYGPTGTEYTGTLVAGTASGTVLDVTTGRLVRIGNGVAMTL